MKLLIAVSSKHGSAREIAGSIPGALHRMPTIAPTSGIDSERVVERQK
jgi:hypothetical protein